jgi:hypothetical protein
MARKKKNKKASSNSSSQQQQEAEDETNNSYMSKAALESQYATSHVSEKQKAVLEKIRAHQVKIDKKAECFEKQDYVENQIKENENKLDELLKDVDEAVRRDAKQIFTEASQVGLFLAKKFPTLTKDHRLATTRLETYKQLCTRLQTERVAMKKKFTDIEEREKKWRAELEGKFETSIQDIKEQINKQEGQNKNIIQHNERMSEEMEALQKENQSLTEMMDVKEKEACDEQARLRAQINCANDDKEELVNHLEQSLRMSQEFKVRLEEYRLKYEELQEGLKKSNEIIAALKKGKNKLISVNSLLSKRNDEYAKKAKLWQGKVEKVTENTKKSAIKLKSLQDLCRSLTEQNRELKASQAGKTATE